MTVTDETAGHDCAPSSHLCGAVILIAHRQPLDAAQQRAYAQNVMVWCRRDAREWEHGPTIQHALSALHEQDDSWRTVEKLTFGGRAPSS